MDLEKAANIQWRYPSIKPPPPGVPVNALAATQILLDLITELRALPTQNHVRSMGAIVDIFSAIKPSTCVGAEQVDAAIDRAEARLREVIDE